MRSAAGYADRVIRSERVPDIKHFWRSLPAKVDGADFGYAVRGEHPPTEIDPGQAFVEA
jgi:hypothetical protein